ncbi:hypothetical protein ILUMI_26267 [Ignelater luminosus]|uniref:Globin domain-containing protein n=1 Tax=Ignelater luminosus TaxID=2038154 RepID=A0A8K0FZ37_IGNLU|nr:hypothetical protein ILUMI_26267 [Ignelater luminosus]
MQVEQASVLGLRIKLKSKERFFHLLFEEHGELLALFEKFKELKTKEDQANSLELAEHASTVMNTLDEGIKGLDNLDAFFEFLHQVGASHRKIPGFKVEYFWLEMDEKGRKLNKTQSKKRTLYEVLELLDSVDDEIFLGGLNVVLLPPLNANDD